MSRATFIVADVFEGLASLEENSVDLVMTSPPFLALRSYLPDGHPDKGKEIGAETTPADYIDSLLNVVEALERVLAPHGSIVFELGDTYAGSGGAGGDYGVDGMRTGQPKFTGSAARFREGYLRNDRPSRTPQESPKAATPPRKPRSSRPKYADVDGGPLRNKTLDTADGIIPARSHTRRKLEGWPLDKSLCGIPSLFAFSLAYGRNLLRPEREVAPWLVRNLVVWARPNPPVGQLSDKFRPATSFLTVATHDPRRFFDLDAVRHEPKGGLNPDDPKGGGGLYRTHPTEGSSATRPDRISAPGGAPPTDYWEIVTKPYSGAHYATFPPELCVKPILSMSPERVCEECGKPRRRIVEVEAPGVGFTKSRAATRARTASGSDPNHNGAPRRTVGWSDCGHDSWRPGVVLDPFAGSGTTLAVATGHGRDAIGIDLDPRNADLARQRVGMWLEVTELGSVGSQVG